MRGFFMRFLMVTALVACVLCTASCTRVIESSADELKMYRWCCEEENGCQVSLSFDDTDAVLSIVSDAYTLELEGLCTADDRSLTIFDSGSGISYTFGYRLYGDRVELSLDSGVLELKKTD